MGLRRVGTGPHRADRGRPLGAGRRRRPRLAGVAGGDGRRRAPSPRFPRSGSGEIVRRFLRAVLSAVHRPRSAVAGPGLRTPYRRSSRAVIGSRGSGGGRIEAGAADLASGCAGIPGAPSRGQDAAGDRLARARSCGFPNPPGVRSPSNIQPSAGGDPWIVDCCSAPLSSRRRIVDCYQAGQTAPAPGRPPRQPVSAPSRSPARRHAASR